MLATILLVVGAVAPVAIAADGHDHGQSTAVASGGLDHDHAQAEENATVTPESSSGDGADEGGDEQDESTVVEEVDEDIRVTAYSYDEVNETMSITFENRGDDRSQVTITEAISSDQAGAGTFGIERVRIGGGSTVTAEIDVRRSDGSAGVMITSTKSLEQGRGVYLQDVEEVSLITGSPAWGFVWLGMLVALFVVGVVLILAAWQHVATIHDDVEDVDVTGDSA